MTLANPALCVARRTEKGTHTQTGSGKWENTSQIGAREFSRCRHAALDRLLLRPTETYAGDPDHCRMMVDSPNDPGVANAWDSSDARGAYEDRPPRAA